MMNGFMYGNVYEDAIRFEKHSVFPRLLSRNAEDFSINNTTFNRDAFKDGTGRRYYYCSNTTKKNDKEEA